MAGSPHVVEVSMANFPQEVVERSRTVPVVVDFWAPWCGPCRALGPLLEALADEMGGKFVLAKVNTDDSPDLAQSFQVEGIPAVFAVRDGKLADQFTGVMPEPQLRAFLAKLLGEPAADPAGDALAQEGRDPAAAEATYRATLAQEPGNFGARVGLARVLLGSPGHEAEAGELLTGIDAGDDLEEADRLRAVIRLREVPHADADLAAARAAAGANPADAAAHLRLGQVLAARGEYVPALDALLAAADEDRALGRGAVREMVVGVFNAIGPRSERADQYRRKLQNLLY